MELILDLVIVGMWALFFGAGLVLLGVGGAALLSQFRLWRYRRQFRRRLRSFERRA